MNDEISYLEFMSKIEKVADDYARIRAREKRLESQRKKANMARFLKKEYEDLDETDLAFCLKRMAEF